MFCPAVNKVAICCLFKAVFVLWRRFGGAPAFSFCRRRLACFKPRQVVQLHTRRLLWLATEDSSKLFQQSRASSEVAARLLSPWPMKKYTCEEQMMEQYHKFSLLFWCSTLCSTQHGIIFYLMRTTLLIFWAQENGRQFITCLLKCLLLLVLIH